MRALRPFDSKVEYARDDKVPLLEFRYRGKRMSPLETGSAIFLGAMIFTAPLALIPFLRSRIKRHYIRLDGEGLVVGKRRYERDRVQRVRVVRFTFDKSQRGNPPVVGIACFYGVRSKRIAARLSEPELLWMHDEIEDFIGMHWGERVATRL